MNYYDEIAQNITDLRISKGLSQAELAEALGVTVATLKRWEAGKVNHIKLSYIIRIRNYFKVSFKDIFGQ